MSKILLLSSGLKHAQMFVDPFLKRLEVYLSSQDNYVDIRNVQSFDERTFFEYDQVVFLFTTALNSIPSSTLEIFQKLEFQEKNHTEVYALLACDEYETEKCDLSEKVLKSWCQRERLSYKGSLKIGSALFIMKGTTKYIVSNAIKNFAQKIFNHQDVYMRVTLLSNRRFMKKANHYWSKEIKKKRKKMKLSNM